MRKPPIQIEDCSKVELHLPELYKNVAMKSKRE